jgi:hypothetical protein
MVALGLNIRQELDGLLLGLVSGDPLDETIRKVQDVRHLADEVVAQAKDLQHAPSTNSLVEWAMQDDAFVTVLESKLAVRRPPRPHTSPTKGGARQP